MKLLVVFIWLVLARYGADTYAELHGIQKDKYFAVTAYPITALGMFLILYFFDKFEKNKS
ncbi:hypothetical protein [Bacillus cereus]|uniref:hypothetical protein n=1 Tax=Bacillus cereus TaxID=1396 RepID=UPI00398141B7